MKTLRSGSRSANTLRHLKQLFNRHSSSARRPISTTAPPSSLYQRSLLSQSHPIPPPSVTAVRHLRTCRNPRGGFKNFEESPCPIRIVVPEGKHMLSNGLGKGDLFLKIVDPKLASYVVEKPKDTLINLARATIQSEVGKVTLLETSTEWKAFNEKISAAVNETAKDCGLHCTRCEIKKIAMPHENEEEWKSVANAVAENLELELTNLEVQKAEREKRANTLSSKIEKLYQLIGREAITAKAISIISGSLEKLKKEEHGEGGIENIPPRPMRLVTNRKANFIEFVREMKAYVGERSGKYLTTLTEGIHQLDPCQDKIAYEYCLKERVVPVPRHNVVTKDNVLMSGDGVFSVKVVDLRLASCAIADPTNAVIRVANPIFSEFAKMTLHDILDDKDALQDNIGKTTNEAAKDWGWQCRYQINIKINIKSFSM
ncbi:OLC1v1002234C1 [Oldenlandia corymbosa var. corymbosa]|uniref:OLC1v1002234C1 n=1 Tax=Oldenlandia corymbosa var. corymbosa TaxID=529605 RepID=A0AAV1D8S3_OLDCO|nr:OLC1v1002234C1 [Oldenlandia corymbosa var. corymbosa]